MSVFAAFLAVTAAAVAILAVLPRERAVASSSVLGLVQAAALLLSAVDVFVRGPWSARLWPLAPWGVLRLGATPLSAFFLLVSGVVFFAVSAYARGYLKRYGRRYDPRVFSIVYHLLVASVALVVVTADVVSFLIAWEAMSVLSYLTVNFDHLDDRATRAGYIMLGASEVGFLLSVAALVPLAVAAHSIDFAVIARTAPRVVGPAARWAILLASFFGFGVKAGLLPSMSWLPRAHPAAPANASAVLSGVILNLGVYGIILVNAVLLPVTSIAAGLMVLAVGALTALIGILYAATENHLKRMLAHSSIENLGLITVAVGTALTFWAAHLPALAALAWIAALYHMLNHSTYKALLFLGAGAVDLSAEELDMDRLGGLGRRMPFTSLFMFAGTMAIAALPPFNGFVSEWLIIQSLLRGVVLVGFGVHVLFALSGVLVALTAGLAVTAFVKFYGMTFLGQSRSSAAEDAREVPPPLRVGMGLLAACALALGLAPTYVAAGLSGVAEPLTGVRGLARLVPPFFAPHRLSGGLRAAFHPLGAQLGLGILPPPGLVFLHQSASPAPHVVFAMSPGYFALAVAAVVGLTFLVVRVLGRARRRARVRPWQGGMEAAPPAMTYTATGLSNPIRVVFRAILTPTRPVDRERVVATHFPASISREVGDAYVVDRYVFLPIALLAMMAARVLARMHHGSINGYVAYAFLTLVAALVVVHFS